MKVILGQRWSCESMYVAEIVDIDGCTNTVKVKVLQVYPHCSWKIGEIFTPANLRADGPSRFWELLEGQDVPQ